MDSLVAETWYCLEKYEEIQESMIPLTLYELVVESLSDPAVKSAEAKNNEKSKEGEGFISKFFSNILKLITNLIQAITNFVSLTFMKPEERRRYEEMKRIKANDPRFKGKTITVRDFRKLEKEYADQEKRIKDRMNKIKNGVDESIDDIVSSTKDLIKRNMQGVVAAVAPEVAMKIASSNIEVARTIKGALEKDKGILDEMAKQVGQREANKFKKQIDHAANRGVSKLSKLYMTLYELRHSKARNLEESFDQIYSEMRTLCGWQGGPLDRVIAVGRNSSIFRRAMKNDALRNSAVQSAKGYLQGKNQANKEQKQLEKERKLGGKDRDLNQGVYASKHNWITGKTDT